MTSSDDKSVKANIRTVPEFALAQEVAPALGDIAVHPVGLLAQRAPTATRPSGKLVFEVDAHGAYWNRSEPNTVFVVLACEITLANVKHADEPPVELGHFALRYQLVYKMNKPADSWTDDQLESFLSYYGMNHVWPYIRADVQAMTAKLELPVLTLPLLKVGQLPARFTISRHADDERPSEEDASSAQTS